MPEPAVVIIPFMQQGQWAGDFGGSTEAGVRVPGLLWTGQVNHDR
jgi:hypothetical protein